MNKFNDHNSTEFDHAIIIYLASVKCSVNKLRQRIHHLFHIVLNIEKDMLRDSDFERVEHKVHHVCQAKNNILYEYHILI